LQGGIRYQDRWDRDVGGHHMMISRTIFTDYGGRNGAEGQGNGSVPKAYMGRGISAFLWSGLR